MSRKTVAFKVNPAPKAADAGVEAWVTKRTADLPEAGAGGNVTPLPQPADPMKRFTIDVSERLHKRIKAQCAMKGSKMADVIRDLLEEAFPERAS